jgi:hypothetical protein
VISNLESADIESITSAVSVFILCGGSLDEVATGISKLENAADAAISAEPLLVSGSYKANESLQRLHAVAVGLSRLPPDHVREGELGVLVETFISNQQGVFAKRRRATLNAKKTQIQLRRAP